MPESRPVFRPQPRLKKYGIAEIELFPRLTRVIYKQLYGEQAPPWKQDRPIQRWFDTVTSVTGEDYHYTYVGQDASGKPTVLGHSIPQFDAKTPNLPGRYDFPDWEPAPTSAYVAARSGLRSPLNPGTLSTRSEARAIMEELGATVVSEAQFTHAVYWYVYPADELRRVWNVQLSGGETKNVGRLLAMKYARGVGAPGHWTNQISNPMWVSEDQPTGEWDTRPEEPIPCRQLYSNEELKRGFGNIAEVRRVDMGEPTISDVYDLVRQLVDMMGG